MPNDCFNRVELTADTPETLAAIAADLLIADLDTPGQQTVTFETLLPTPYDLLKGEGWYEWRLNHWGNAWDAYDVNIDEQSDERIAFTCSTAWGPPIAFVAALRAKHPDVGIEWFYDEPGMRIAGYL